MKVITRYVCVPYFLATVLGSFCYVHGIVYSILLSRAYILNFNTTPLTHFILMAVCGTIFFLMAYISGFKIELTDKGVLATHRLFIVFKKQHFVDYKNFKTFENNVGFLIFMGLGLIRSKDGDAHPFMSSGLFRMEVEKTDYDPKNSNIPKKKYRVAYNQLASFNAEVEYLKKKCGHLT